jgi:glycosyltransferase involved in cell wall biosynthesis
MPTLSVLIPNYNHGRYAAHCLDQIFSQDFPPSEVIVVDDCSTDDSVEIIARYASREPRLRFFRNPSNFGVMKTMNRALSLARGDYVYGGAADDWVAPRAFQKAMEMLRRYPGAGLCFGYVSQCHAGTGKITPLRSPICAYPRYFSPDELAEAFLRESRPGDCVVVPGNGAVWKRAEFIGAGGYQEGLRWYGDWFPLQVVALRHGACFIPECLAFTRMNHRSFSSAGQKDWPEQQVVLDRMIRLIKTKQFRDVLPRFQKGLVFSQMLPGLARVVISQREHWDRDSALLIQSALERWWRTFLLCKDPVVRLGTATCLGCLGPAAHEFVPELCRFLKSKPRTREPVEMALGKICLRAPSQWPLYWQYAGKPAIERFKKASSGAAYRAVNKVKKAPRDVAKCTIKVPAYARMLAAWMYRAIHWKIYRRIQALEGRIAEVRREEGQRYEELVGQLEALREEAALLSSRLSWGPSAARDHGRPAIKQFGNECLSESGKTSNRRSA